MMNVEIIVCTDNKFIHSKYQQYRHATYLSGDNFEKPVINEYSTREKAIERFSDFLMMAATYNYIDIKPIAKEDL